MEIVFFARAIREMSEHHGYPDKLKRRGGPEGVSFIGADLFAKGTRVKHTLAPLLGLTIVLVSPDAVAQTRVLVYARNHVTNGHGYVHDNIASSVEAIKKIGSENGFDVDTSDDPSVFNSPNLRRYRTLIFSNSNNEAFETDAQREAFQRFIHRGGGFVGIHSASGSERHWPYFWSVLGGTFAAHPRYQSFTVRVVNKSLPGMKNLPASFSWADECYFIDHLNPDIHPVLTTSKSEIAGTETMHLDLSKFPENLPIAWFHRFDHGREFYLALGHAKEDYSNPLFLKILTAGILWANR